MNDTPQAADTPQIGDHLNTTSEVDARFDFGARAPGRFPRPVNTPSSSLLGRYRRDSKTGIIVRDANHWKPGSLVFSRDGTEYTVGARGQLFAPSEPSWKARRADRRNRAFNRKMNWVTGVKLTRAEMAERDAK